MAFPFASLGCSLRRSILPLGLWIVFGFATGSAFTQDQEDLPLLSEMKVPSAESLLRDDAVTWIVLKGDEKKVIVCEPITPRPDTLKKMEQEVQASYDWPPGRTEQEREEVKDKRNELNFIRVVLPNAEENPEFKLHRRYVEEVVHHEDLMLRRIDSLMSEGNLRLAYEMLYQLKKDDADWPGIPDRETTMLLRQGEVELEKGNAFESLVYLEQLHRVDPEKEGLQPAIGRAAEQLIGKAADAEEFRKARHYLGRLRRVNAEHEVATKWVSTLTDRAQKLLDQSAEATREGEHKKAAELATEAAKVWPKTRGLRSRFDSASRRFQSLRVGVRRLSTEESSYPLPTWAQERERNLLNAQLFRVKSFDTVPHYESRYFEEWEPLDLGKRTQFRLRSTKPDWDPTPLLTAVPIVNDLQARIDPGSERYDERLANEIRELSVESPFEFTVYFRSAPLRLESLLNFPVRQSQSSDVEAADADAATPEATAEIITRRFTRYEQGPGRMVYRRVNPQPNGMPDDAYRIAEVVEFKYPSPERAIQGILRDEVQMLDLVRPWEVALFGGSKEFTTVKYSLPRTHVLQVNPASERLKNGEFRRALSHAIDRETILRDLLLRDPEMKFGRVVSGPFPSRSYANDPLLPAPKYDPALSFALLFGAKRALDTKTLPALKLLCPPEAEVEAAADRMIAAWKRLGITVERIPRDAETPEDWDLVYRLTSMAEPMTQLWPFLTLQPTARMVDLEYLPDWMRHELVALDQAANFEAAVRRLQTLHRMLLYRGDVIPLWEIDRHLVFRTRAVRRYTERDFQGTVSLPMNTYQKVERWLIEPWYETTAD